MESGQFQVDAGIHLWVGFHGTTLDEELKSLIRRFRIGGIVLFRRNIEGPEQLRSLLLDTQKFAREYLGRGLLVSIDQEGGPVQRLTPPFTQLPAASDLADEGPRAVVEWTAKAARELHEMGIHINLAPVLDVASADKSHFMRRRSLGTEPETVADLGKLWIKTLQENGVSATAKHYPGLGQAQLDPHHFAPVIHWTNEEAMWRDLHPFREAMQAGVHCIMTSHALYPYLDPEWPATLSPTLNREWLRDRLGFSNVLLSDDMDMAAVSEHFSWSTAIEQGFLASIDCFLLCQHSEHIEPFYRALAAVYSNGRTRSQMRTDSLRRIQTLLKHHHLIA